MNLLPSSAAVAILEETFNLADESNSSETREESNASIASFGERAAHLFIRCYFELIHQRVCATV